MRIGINASFIRKPNTGIGQVTVNFLKKLTEVPSSEFRVPSLEFILYLEEDTDLKLPDNFQKKVVLPFWKRDDLIRAMWRDCCTLPKQITKDQCDIFVNLYQSAIILPEKIKHIMVVHDIIPELFPEYLNNSRKRKFWKMTKEAIRKADKIIAVSSRTEKDLIQHLGLDSEKISVNYIDVDPIYKKEVSEDRSQKILKNYQLKKGYILGGGGLEVRKNIEGLIMAYQILLESNKKTHFIKDFPDLVISGKLLPKLAPLVTDAEKIAKELNLTKKIKLLDFVAQEDLPVIYKNAEIFVYPSRYEGFGLPVLEAMNAGTPVIASKKSSLPEVGRDAVLYCNPEDVHDIAMVMRNVLSNEHLRGELRKRGKERAQNFSWEKFVEKLFNIVNK